jgi:hypothetical protein
VLALWLLLAATDPAAKKLQMRRMTAEINQRTFADRKMVTCWMCHRGEREPPKLAAFSREVPEGFPVVPDWKQPTERVFKDVRELRGMDARNFALMMGWFSRELGVKCAYCHAEGDFAADAPRKQRAREMLQMTTAVASGFYGGDSPVGCGTCHRGEPIPLTAPGRHAK